MIGMGELLVERDTAIAKQLFLSPGLSGDSSLILSHREGAEGAILYFLSGKGVAHSVVRLDAASCLKVSGAIEMARQAISLGIRPSLTVWMDKNWSVTVRDNHHSHKHLTLVLHGRHEFYHPDSSTSGHTSTEPLSVADENLLTAALRIAAALASTPEKSI